MNASPQADGAASVRARPFLKWAGGKSGLLKEILPRLPRQFNRYYEPFVGGGAVFFALQPKEATLSDINGELIHTYRTLQRHAPAVIDGLTKLRANLRTFQHLRALRPDNLETIARATRLLYLNKTCFNGLYRVNKKGEFNVPYGSYLRARLCDADNLRRVQRALRRVRLRCQSVEQLRFQCRIGDLVYLDPPYDAVSSTARFVQYTSAGFNVQAQERLATLCLRLADRGIHIVLSNADTPLVRRLYAKFRIDRIWARRSINCQGAGRAPVPEVIVRSW